ncbi:sodium:solute symporter family transporter [Gephyromycinifex aptenodytis]|uniref:sodium:solute symporter family transporter n=1 Tax=Gephyromycinifex aptenodytis TaxID=2716227 RepID=UPI0014455583|nr:sodium:solute symporter [Gephyromycinifex aptenodytis]
MTLPTIDYAVIAVYFLVMVVIGFISMRMAKTREDYLVAGRRLGFPLFFGCMAALAVGGAVTVGGAEKGYRDGIAGLWVGGSLGMGLIVLGMLVSSKLNRLRALSINEVIERNYGTAARLLGAILTIIYTVSLSVVQVVAMGSILHGILGWNLTGSMVLAGSVVVFYTFLGGMWSVTLTDIVQFVVKTLGVLILVPIFALADPRIGGFSGLLDKIPEGHLDPFAYGWMGTLYWVLLYVPGLVIGQDIWQRIFTARNEKIARTGTLLAGFYSIIYGLAAVVLGMAVAIIAPTLEVPNAAFVTGVMEFLPAGLSGLLLAAALAASMSVASGTILACSTVVYNDLFLRFVRGQRSSEPDGSALQRLEEERATHSAGHIDNDVWVNRLIALVIGVAIIGLSVAIEDIFKALDLAYGFLSGCVFVPVIASFLLKRVSPKAGLAALATSALGMIAAYTFGLTGAAAARLGEDAAGEWVIGGNIPIMIGMGLGVVVFAVVSMIDREKKPVNVAIDPNAPVLPEAS